MKAIARSLRITSKKINLIANLVRRKSAVEALNILKFTPKKGAKILYKVVRSAVANAENNFKQDRPSLYIKEIVVTEASTMKRSVPVSRGRANPILKRNAHVWVILGVKDEAGTEVEKKNGKEAKDTSEKSDEKKSKKDAPKARVVKESVKVTTKKETAAKKKTPKKDA